MAKPWARLEQNYINHPKFLALNANAICLWHEAKNYCDMHQTDGLIPREALKTFRFAGRKAVELLTTSAGPKPWGTSEQFAPLWEPHDIGFKMHDYLNHNDCRDAIVARIDRTDQQRSRDARRQQLFRDKDLQAEIRARDGHICRYCGREVSWSDRRSPLGATYDHVDPDGPNTLSNVVTACRGCNSAKGNRHPDEADMVLLPTRGSTVGSTARNKNDIERRTPTATATVIETETQIETVRPSDGSAAARVDAPGSKRPIFTGQRLTVFEWFLDKARKILGDEHLDRFDIHGWFFDLDAAAAKTDMVIPDRDNGAWLAAQLVAEAKRRGLPIASAPARGPRPASPFPSAAQYAWNCPHEPRCPHRAACQIVSMRGKAS